MKERMHEFDYMRAAAAVSVIAIHATGWYITVFNIGYWLNMLMRYAVPLFIIISGLLLAYSYREKPGVPYMPFMYRRLSKILIPYLIWNAVYIWMYVWGSPAGVTAGLTGNFWALADFYLNKLWMGNAQVHMYFMVIIFQLYLLFPPLLKCVRRFPAATLAVTFAMTLYFHLADYLLAFARIRLIPEIFTHRVPLYIMFPMYIFYFTAGMYLALHIEALKKFALRWKYLIVAAFAAAFGLMVVDNKLTHTNFSSVKPSVMVYTFTAFLLFYIIGLTAKNKWAVLDKFIVWFSAQSFFIYLSHIAVMDLIRRFTRTGSAFAGRLGDFLYGRAGVYIFLVLSVAVTTALAYAVSLVPFASIFGAVRTRLRAAFIPR